MASWRSDSEIGVMIHVDSGEVCNTYVRCLVVRGCCWWRGWWFLLNRANEACTSSRGCTHNFSIGVSCCLCSCWCCVSVLVMNGCLPCDCSCWVAKINGAKQFWIHSIMPRVTQLVRFSESVNYTSSPRQEKRGGKQKVRLLLEWWYFLYFIGSNFVSCQLRGSNRVLSVRIEIQYFRFRISAWNKQEYGRELVKHSPLVKHVSEAFIRSIIAPSRMAYGGSNTHSSTVAFKTVGTISPSSVDSVTWKP